MTLILKSFISDITENHKNERYIAIEIIYKSATIKQLTQPQFIK